VDRLGKTAYRETMTNRIAIWIVLAVLAALAADLLLGLGATLFIARRFVGLIDWIAFWR